MLVANIVNNIPPIISCTIGTYCGEFLDESSNLPLYRQLPHKTGLYKRVKARARKSSTSVSEAINDALSDKYHHLSQRAIYTSPSLPETTVDLEPYYVFPINGYQYVYFKNVTSAHIQYEQMLHDLETNINHNNVTQTLVTDVMKHTYESTNLVEGIQTNSEIMIYNIPFYYAVRVSSFPNYNQLLNIIRNKNV